MSNKKKSIYFTISLILASILVLALTYESLGKFFGLILSLSKDILIGLCLAYLLNPIFNFFRDKIFKKIRNEKLRKTVSILITIIIAVLIISGFLLLIIPQLISSITTLKDNFRYYIADAEYFLKYLCEKIHIDPNRVNLTELGEKIKTYFLNEILKIFTIVSNIGISVGSSILGAVKTIIIAVFVAIYFILDKDKMKTGILELSNSVFGEKFTRHRAEDIAIIDRSFGKYLIGKMSDALLVAIILSIAYSISGMPFPFLLAALIGFMNVIPFFGAILGCVPAGFFVLIARPEKFILFVIITLVLQQIDANILEPKILGHHTGLGRFGVLSAVTIAGNLFGFFGLIISVPLFASIKIFIQKYIIDREEPEVIEPITEPEPQILLEEDVMEFDDSAEKKINVIKKFIKKIIK